MKNIINNSIPIVAFCSPGPAIIDLPCKVVESSYKYLKELGVDILLGQDEIFGINQELDDLVFKAIDFCEKYDIYYFPRLEIIREFVSLKNTTRKPYYKPFQELTDSEKLDLKNRFLKLLEPLMKRKPCIGIAFQDEPGLEMLPGVKYAKDIFMEAYPDKIFYVNNICCLATDACYYYGQYHSITKDTKTCNSIFPEQSISNRFIRYKTFMDKFYEFLPKDDVYSYDSYAIHNLAGSTCSVNRVLYDMPYYVNKVCESRGKRYWNFIQLSKFDELTRVPKYNEFLLQINISLALGSKGIELFPVCYPNDFYGNQVFGGSPLDEFGNKFSTFEPLKRAITVTRSIRENLINDKVIGFKLFGNYRDYEDLGFKQGNLKILEKVNGDAAFNGVLDWRFNEECFKDIQIECNNQVAIGRFENNKYLIVNNSTKFVDDVTIELQKEFMVSIIRNNKKSHQCSKTIFIKGLEAGESILLILKND